MSLQTDLDLAEMKDRPAASDCYDLHVPQSRTKHSTRFRSAGPMGSESAGTGRCKLGTIRGNDRGDYEALREFTTVAALAAGQQFAPLVPPITHDGQPVTFARLSPDNQTLLTLGKDFTARLWESANVPAHRHSSAGQRTRD